jgi:hypothetical protein
VKVQGSSNLSIQGSIIADRAIISGSGFEIDASGFITTAALPPSISLVE